MQDPEIEVELPGQLLAGARRLRLTLGGQINVLPSSKEVELIPLGLAVA